MANDENSRQPISNQVSDTDEYHEIFNFLEHELGMPPLDVGKMNMLGYAIADAIRSLHGKHTTDHARYTRLVDNKRLACELVEAMRHFFDDTQTLMLLGSYDADYLLPGFMQLENRLCTYAATIENVIAEHWPAPPNNSRGGQFKGDAFSMFVFHLMNGWEDAYGKKASTTSSPFRVPPKFRAEKIKPGQRGGKFVYFAYVVNRFSGVRIEQGQFGVAVRETLKELREMPQDTDVPLQAAALIELIDDLDAENRVK